MGRYGRAITLEVEGAGCDRGDTPVLRGVSVVISPGEAVQLFGANGSGKTSLLTLFAGLIEPAEGAVRWRAGGNEMDKPFNASLFFLGHETAVKPALTAEENLLFWASLYGVAPSDAKQRVRDALEALGMASSAGVKAMRLSAGQRRRVDLARALLADREVWLLDEPVASLDREGVAIASNMIASHLARGGIAIVATHADLAISSRRLELCR